MPEAGTRPVLDVPPLRSVASTFHAAPAQVALARQFLAGQLTGSPAREDAVLCLSEIAANAVLHSASRRPGGTFTVRVAPVAAGVRVEVTDEGGPWQASGDADALSGHGLDIVGRVAARWGVTGDDSARTVWFEITR